MRLFYFIFPLNRRRDDWKKKKTDWYYITMDYKVARIGPTENREIDLCISAFVLFKESRWPLFCVCVLLAKASTVPFVQPLISTLPNCWQSPTYKFPWFFKRLFDSGRSRHPDSPSSSHFQFSFESTTFFICFLSRETNVGGIKTLDDAL